MDFLTSVWEVEQNLLEITSKLKTSLIKEDHINSCLEEELDFYIKEAKRLEEEIQIAKKKTEKYEHQVVFLQSTCKNYADSNLVLENHKTEIEKKLLFYETKIDKRNSLLNESIIKYSKTFEDYNGIYQSRPLAKKLNLYMSRIKEQENLLEDLLKQLEKMKRQKVFHAFIMDHKKFGHEVAKIKHKTNQVKNNIQSKLKEIDDMKKKIHDYRIKKDVLRNQKESPSTTEKSLLEEKATDHSPQSDLIGEGFSNSPEVDGEQIESDPIPRDKGAANGSDLPTQIPSVNEEIGEASSEANVIPAEEISEDSNSADQSLMPSTSYQMAEGVSQPEEYAYYEFDNGEEEPMDEDSDFNHFIQQMEGGGSQPSPDGRNESFMFQPKNNFGQPMFNLFQSNQRSPSPPSPMSFFPSTSTAQHSIENRINFLF